MPDRYDPTGQDRVVPTVVLGPGAGTGPPAPTVDPQSSDERGSVSFGSGTTPAAGVIFTLTFAAPRDPNRLPKVLLQEATSALAGVDLAVTSITATGFTVSTNTRNLAASQAAGTYGLHYFVMD
jgi:hypothetical protein